MATASAVKLATSSPQEIKAKNFIPKPEKPNEEQFRKELAEAEKEHDDAKAKLSAIKEKLSLAQSVRQGEGANPAQARQTTLRAEFATLRDEQQSRKASRQRIFEQIKIADGSLKSKINDQKNARAKIPYKSIEEIDKSISNLEKQVESGKMKLVDEKKALNEITILKRQRKNFDALETAQAAIDADKAKIAELKKQLDDPEGQALSERMGKISAELDEIKAEQDAVYQNLSSLRDERTRIQNIEREKFQAKKAIEEKYHSARIAYREYERSAAAARRARIRAEREEREREHKKKIARQKMEEASVPAFTSEILTCEGLIAHFDPNSPEALAARTKSALLQDKGLKATDIRTITTELKGVKLVKKEARDDDYFVGSPGKGKRGKKSGSRNDSASGTGSNTPNPEDKGKFQLNHGILVELHKVDVTAPSGWDDVPQVLSKLREKLAWYKENSDRVTKENVERAQKEIEALERLEPGDNVDASLVDRESADQDAREQEAKAEMEEDQSEKHERTEASPADRGSTYQGAQAQEAKGEMKEVQSEENEKADVSSVDRESIYQGARAQEAKVEVKEVQSEKNEKAGNEAR